MGGPRPETRTRLMPHDLSPWGMFLNADIVVKLVMLGLVFASLVTWTVWLAKSIELVMAKRAARRGLATLLSASSLDGAARSGSSGRAQLAQFLDAALAELRASAGLPAEGVKERIGASLSRCEARAGRVMMRSTGL